MEVAVAEVTETLHQSPEVFGLSRSRWWLNGLRQTIPWMSELSLSAIHQLLDRFDIAYKQGRRYVHSPDLTYSSKAAHLRTLRQEVSEHPGRLVLLYEDELTYYRCPSVAPDYRQRGFQMPLANQGCGYNSSRRIAGCLDAFTGRLICWQRSAFDHRTFLRYLQAVEACYPDAERIYIVLDNWPVHFQPDVLASLEPSKITLVFLPTYSPWLNPIEKVWRKLKQEVLHLHRYSSAWHELQECVEQWLIQYNRAAPDLLHYVGLLPH